MLKVLLPPELQSLEQKASWGTSAWQWGNRIFYKPLRWEGQPASSSHLPESCRCFLSLGRIYSPTSGEIWSCPWRAVENVPPAMFLNMLQWRLLSGEFQYLYDNRCWTWTVMKIVYLGVGGRSADADPKPSSASCGPALWAQSLGESSAALKSNLTCTLLGQTSYEYIWLIISLLCFAC